MSDLKMTKQQWIVFGIFCAGLVYGIFSSIFPQIAIFVDPALQALLCCGIEGVVGAVGIFMKGASKTEEELQASAEKLEEMNEKQVEKMVKLANITVPPNVQENISKLKDKDLIEFGIEYATSQCEELIKNGIKGLHFYTLNKSYSTNEILNNIKGVNIWKI